MALLLQTEQKKHLEFFTNQPTKVLSDVLQNISAGEVPTAVESERDQASQALLKLLVDATKLKLSEKDFSAQTSNIFKGEHLAVLCNFLSADVSMKDLITSDELSFRDLEWRLEAKIASRFSHNLPIEPKISIKIHLDQEKSFNHRLVLSETSKDDTKKEVLLQTEVNSLVYIIKQLQAAKLAASEKKAAKAS